LLMSGAVPTSYSARIARLRIARMVHKPFPLETLQELLLQFAGDGLTLTRDQ